MARQFLALFLAPAAALACAACGGELPIGETASAIVGGTYDSGDSAVVALVSDAGFLCTAEVIAPQVLLTAAHCLLPSVECGVTGATPHRFDVYLGPSIWDAAGNLGAPALQVSAARAHVHPAYVPEASNLGNDIGVLITDAPLTGIRPLPVNFSGVTSGILNNPVRLVGYGTTAPFLVGGRRSPSGTKQQVTLSRVNYANHIVFNIGTPSAEGCTGDSGGPALSTISGVETIIGLTSYNDDDFCTTGALVCSNGAYYTRVDRYSAFLNTYLQPPAAPALLEPAAASASQEGQTVRFRWDPVSGANRYRLAICATPTLSGTCRIEEPAVGRLEFSASNISAGTWYWAVGAIGEAESVGWGPYSSSRSLSITAVPRAGVATVSCAGSSCSSAPSPLPNNASASATWSPCGAGAFTWTASGQFELDYDRACVGGVARAGFRAGCTAGVELNGAGPWSGSASGAITVSLATDGNVNSTGLTSLFATCTVRAAELASPTPGSTLAGSSATFQWTSGSGVLEYFLYAGSALGANDLYGASQGTRLSATVGGLPVDGRAIYIRLWSLLPSGWEYRDYNYTASSAGGVPAELIRPVPGSTFLGGTLSFEWSSGTGVLEYFLYLGNSPGANDLYGASLGTVRSIALSGVPTDGRAVYVRLYSRLSSGWTYRDYSYTAASLHELAAELISPAPGSILSGASAFFQWSAGSGASEYFLYVGSALGANDLYGASQGSNLVATVNGLPTDGRTLYVRLYSLLSAGWTAHDYVYTAATRLPAELLSPAPGSRLPTPAVTFQWSAGTGASEYFLYLGTAPGSNDLYGATQVTNLSVTLSLYAFRIPTDGRTIYVRLYSLLDTSWTYRDYTYTAPNEVAAELLSPASGSTLPGSSVSFAWSAGSGVSQYFLYAGSAQGANDLYSALQGASLSVTVGGLPVDGRAIYVRLWSLLGGGWTFRDYAFSARNDAAEILSPPPGSVLPGSTATFAWTLGPSVLQHYLTLGSAPGDNDLYGTPSAIGETSATFTGLPVDGRSIYLRLWSLVGLNWIYRDYVYVAASIPGVASEMISPSPGSAFAAASVIFTWSPGSAVLQSHLSVGRMPGSGDFYGAAASSPTTVVVPTDGATIYVRLWSQLPAGWEYRDYVYTAATIAAGVAADLISPRPGSILSGASASFAWTTGTGVSQYFLSLGSTPGGNDLYDASQGSSLSTSSPVLPVDGRLIYLRLWSVLSSGSVYRDYTFRAAGGSEVPAELLDPPPGSTLPESSVSFTWSAGAGSLEYYLYVGSTIGERDLYGASQGTNLSASIANLPADGRTIYVRLWTLLGAGWEFRDFIYTVE